MNSLVALQHWLYGGMASGLGEVAGAGNRVGRVLQVGSSVMVLVFGLWMVLRSLTL